MFDVQPQLLIVDDARDIREPLALYLRRNGFRTRVAESAEEARKILAETTVHLLVLDVCLPKEGGLSLCNHLQQTQGPPVILLSAMAAEDDTIAGLDAGADDYITKPFNPAQLVARVRALLRRVPPELGKQQPVAYSFAGRVFNSENAQLSLANGESRRLTSGECRLLQIFLEHPHEILSRQRLIDRVHGRDLAAFDRAIDSLVSRLRRKIDDTDANARIIATEWGGGYRLNCNCTAT